MLLQVFDYVEQTWVGSNARWKPESWSAFHQSIRTNNDVEGWHHALNKKAPHSNLSFYKLVPLLHDQARLVTIQMTLVNERRLCRYQRRKYRELHGRLSKLWTKLDNKEKTPMEVLDAAAHLYGNLPVTDQ